MEPNVQLMDHTTHCSMKKHLILNRFTGCLLHWCPWLNHPGNARMQIVVRLLITRHPGSAWMEWNWTPQFGWKPQETLKLKKNLFQSAPCIRDGSSVTRNKQSGIGTACFGIHIQFTLEWENEETSWGNISGWRLTLNQLTQSVSLFSINTVWIRTQKGSCRNKVNCCLHNWN